MSAPLTNISENDHFDSIFHRLEEIKRIWKTLKGSLLESLSNFDQFGKALNKNTRGLLGTCNPSDPSSYTVITLNLLTTEDKMSQRYIHFAQSVSSQLSKSVDEYSEKIESTHTMLADSAAVCMRQITSARQDYAKEKAKYEKVCKETEALVLEKKKLTSDPLLYYNLVQQKRVRARLWNKIKELREAEIQMKEAIDSINDKQPILNSTLSDVLKTFRVALKTALKNMLEAIRRHNKGLGDLVNKNLEDSSRALASSPQAKDQNEAEEKYIEDQYKQRSRSNLDDEIKEGEQSPFASAKDIGSEDTFVQIQKKLVSSTEKLQDLQVMMYGEEIQKHYEVFCAVVDDRRKIIQGLRAYMQEIAVLWENLSKLVQKTSKTPFPNISNSFAFYKRVGTHLDPFYNALGTLVKKFQNFGTFIIMKLSAIDNIIADQKTNFKSYQSNMQKAIKEHLNCRVALETCFQNQEKTQKKIAEISEKDEHDPRLPKMKKELDTLMVQHVELREELRSHAVETAKVITKIEQDFRKVESAKSQSFKLIIEGILGQENCLYQEISSVVKTVNEAIEPDTGIEAEVMLIFGQDEKLAECLRYGDNVKGHKLALAFQKIYVPPVEYATEYEKGQIGALGILYPGEPIDIEDVQDKREDEGVGNTVDEEVKENDIDKSSPSKIENKFQMKSTDKLLGDFSCAMVVQVLPRQGWMYVYENKVCFLSSKLFGDFTMKFPIKDIVKADKKVISLVFDNAMSLTTKYGEIIFTTFFSRDKALSLIESCMKGEQGNDDGPKSPKTGLLNLKEVEKSNDIQESKDDDNRRGNYMNSDLIEKLNLRPEKEDPKVEPVNNEIETAEIIKEKANVMEELKMRKNTIEKSMIGKDSFPVIVIQEIFNCSVSEAFNAVLSDRPVEYRGKKAETVLILTKIEGGDTEIKATKWEPAPPKSILENDTSLEGLRALVKANEKSSRSFTFTHPVESGMAFLPKSCPVDEKQVVYWLNMDEIVIQAEVRSSKVPLSDCFLVRNSFTLKNIEGNKCEFTWRYGIEFVKSTMFKGKISKTSQDENLDFAKKVALPIIREKMAEYVNTLKRQKENVSRTLKTDGQQAVMKENREEGKVERKEREGSNEHRDFSQKVVNNQLDDDLREVLKTYISETKKAQEGMLSEFIGIKFWMMVLTIMNSLILFVLLIK